MKCPVSVIIPTFNRAERLISTLEEIRKCEPCPEQIIVHIDGNDKKTEDAVRQKFDDIEIILNPLRVGPGGGRNILIKAAKHEIVASFDDDSYPLDQDYFARLLEVFRAYSTASIVAGAIYDRHQQVDNDAKEAIQVASFVGCGCAYRKSDFLETEGYLNLPLAYGAEEVDLAIQLYEKNKRIIQTNWLRIYHDTSYEHHKNREVNAASISNLALLAYMRYPIGMTGLSFLQIFNRVIYALQRQRYEGIMLGLASIPSKLWLNRHRRQPLPSAMMQEYLRLRRQPIFIPWQD